MAKTLAVVFGIIFVLIGLLGFVPNPLVGPGALLHTDAMHNVVHLVLGAVLLLVAYMAPRKAAVTLIAEGVIYLALAVLGFVVIPEGGALIGAEMNHADHWLHVVLGVAMIAAGYFGKNMPSRVSAAPVADTSEPLY